MNLIEKESAIRAIEEKAYGVGSVARTYYERAIKAIDDLPIRAAEADAPEVPKWTPADKKPKRKGLYLCYMVVGAEEWQEVCMYEGKGKWADLDGHSDTAEVFAWMPLPEKPE